MYKQPITKIKDTIKPAYDASELSNNKEKQNQLSANMDEILHQQL
jgi:hypothetical protein